MSFCPPWYFWTIAVACSLFHGLYAIQIHLRPKDFGAANPAERTGWKAVFEAIHSPAYMFEVWFNFAGSMMGWLAGYALYMRYQYHELGVFDIFLVLIAALGIVGYLPFALHGVAGSPTLAAEYLRKKLTSGGA